MHSKYDDYERAGIDEYLVLKLHDREVLWFIRDGGSFSHHAPDGDGIYRSRRFAGLWLDAEAIFNRDTKRLRDVLDTGIASPGHATFVGH